MSSNRTRLTAAIVAWAIASLIAVVATLAIVHVDRAPTPDAGAANLQSLLPLWLASASAWGALTALWWLVIRGRTAGSTRSIVLILVVAAGTRVAVVALADPTLSDDVYRYVFDGRNTATGTNPYLPTPAQRLELDADEPRGDVSTSLADPTQTRTLEALINNPELHTIYLPTSQWIFAGVALITPEAWREPLAAVRVFRSVLVLFELAAVGLLLVALVRAGRSPWWLALYAWHPLPLVEVAASGHQEPLGVLFLVAAMVLATGGRKSVAGWTGLLALASLVKPMVLPVAAFALRGRRWAAWSASLLVGAGVCVVVASPLWLTHDAEPIRSLMETAERFRLKWAHFGSVYEPLLWSIERVAPGWGEENQEVLARRLCVATLLIVLVVLYLRCRDLWRATAWMFLAMVLLSPAAHPWYLLWGLVLVPMAPVRALWVGSLTLPWGYAVLGDVVTWTVSPWIMVAAYLPVYAAAATELVGWPRTGSAPCDGVTDAG